jgi:hypothetical protein
MIARTMGNIIRTFWQKIRGNPRDNLALRTELEALETAIANIELTPGPPGPQGNPGDNGANGNDGAQGEPGQPGENGAILKASLLAIPAVENAGVYRVADATPPQRRAWPDGTNWRWMDDSSIVT